MLPETEPWTVVAESESGAPLEAVMQANVDFDRRGRQLGELRLPHSPHEDAWGVIPIPVAVFNNGDGPTLVLVGGVHGDEYEGPIALCELIRTLDPGSVNGRLIVLPALNRPAVLAGRRTSPLDGLNLARAFPGDPVGPPTAQIAHYVTAHVLPIADAVVDLHAGGSSMEILTAGMMRRPADAAAAQSTEAAVRAFGAPQVLVTTSKSVAPTTLVGAALTQGLVSFAVELGGGGSVSPGALAIARRGVRNMLVHFGLISGVPDSPYTGPLWEISLPDCCLYAPRDGVFEPLTEPGAQVADGDAAGRIHDIDDPDAEPMTVHFARPGLQICRRVPARVERGNCLAVVAALGAE